MQICLNATRPRNSLLRSLMSLMALLAATLCVSCGGKVKTDREFLYELLLSNDLHEEHKCRDVLPAIHTETPDEIKSSLWRRIEHADMEDVSQCLLQVGAYNVCYAGLECDVLSDDTYPTWAGWGSQPCGCGTSEATPLGQWLPDSLGECGQILPVFDVPWVSPCEE